MKRMLVRLAALGLVVVGGFFAIAQAQRIMAKPGDTAAQSAVPAPTTPNGEPLALAEEGANQDMPKARSVVPRDPFAGSRLMDSMSDAPPSKPVPLTKSAKIAAESDSRYPELDTAAANPLRGASSPAVPKAPQILVRDAQVAGASHTEEPAPPPAEKKPAARRDPFDLHSPPAGAPLADAPNAVGLNKKPLGDRYAVPPATPEPSTKSFPADLARRYPQNEPAEPAPLREVPGDCGAAGIPLAGAAAPRPATRDARVDSGDRYAAANKSLTTPQELPRDESLRSMPSGRRSDSVGIEGASRSATGRGMARRDPGAARPGSRQLDGPQTPQVSVQKIAPAEIQVGTAATFQILVRNTGTISARDVVVRDVVPEGTSLVSTSPPAQSDGTDLQWSLGTLQPGEEKSLAVKLMPQTEGEIGSVASVTFQAEASARSVSTRPELLLEMTAPRQVMIGENAVVSIRVSNTGSGVASNVVLHQKLPPQLKHAAGDELEFDVGDLKPREARQVDLTLTAAVAGKVVEAISARGQGGLTAKASAELEVLSPALEMSLEGPRRRFLEREATYTLSVANPGTAPAKDVELVSRLPKGLKFVSANNAGQYNQQNHAVYWSLAELPQGETGTVKLVTLPIEAGDQKLIIEGRADRNISHRQEEKIEIEGLAAVMFEVVDVADPIEVGGETAYEVRVINQGTRAADNVQIVVLLPAEMKGLSAEGPTRGVVDRDRVVFEPLARLAPKADTTYRIRVQGMAPGDHRARIQLKTDDMSAPVTKEESTRVFADQ